MSVTPKDLDSIWKTFALSGLLNLSETLKKIGERFPRAFHRRPSLPACESLAAPSGRNKLNEIFRLIICNRGKAVLNNAYQLIYMISLNYSNTSITDSLKCSRYFCNSRNSSCLHQPGFSPKGTSGSPRLPSAQPLLQPTEHSSRNLHFPQGWRASGEFPEAAYHIHVACRSTT